MVLLLHWWSHHRSAGQEETRLQILALFHIDYFTASVSVLRSLLTPKDLHPNPSKSLCKARLTLTKLYPSVLNLKLEKLSFILESLVISFPNMPHSRATQSKVSSSRHYQEEYGQIKWTQLLKCCGFSQRRRMFKSYRTEELRYRCTASDTEMIMLFLLKVKNNVVGKLSVSAARQKIYTLSCFHYK